jgi:hypothetical protein
MTPFAKMRAQIQLADLVDLKELKLAVNQPRMLPNWKSWRC